MLPIRCYTCNSCIDCLWGEYEENVVFMEETAESALDKMGISEECCRKLFVQGYVAAAYKIGKKKRKIEKVLESP